MKKNFEQIYAILTISIMGIIFFIWYYTKAIKASLAIIFFLAIIINLWLYRKSKEKIKDLEEDDLEEIMSRNQHQVNLFIEEILFSKGYRGTGKKTRLGRPIMIKKGKYYGVWFLKTTGMLTQSHIENIKEEIKQEAFDGVLLLTTGTCDEKEIDDIDIIDREEIKELRKISRDLRGV